MQGINKEQPDWSGIIETSSVYKTLYYLYIIDYLIDDDSEAKTSADDQTPVAVPRLF